MKDAEVVFGDRVVTGGSGGGLFLYTPQWGPIGVKVEGQSAVRSLSTLVNGSEEKSAYMEY